MSGATGAAAPPALTGLQNPYSFLDVRDQIGKGAYGKVFKCVLNNVKQLVAVKVVPIVEEEEDAIALELQVLASHSSHRNIARFYGAYADYGPKDDFLGDGKPQLWLAMQYCAYGSATSLVAALRKPKANIHGACAFFPSLHRDAALSRATYLLDLPSLLDFAGFVVDSQNNHMFFPSLPFSFLLFPSPLFRSFPSTPFPSTPFPSTPFPSTPFPSFVNSDVSKTRKPMSLPENCIAYIAKECLAGLEYLHSNKIIHRDIKGQNVLFTRDMRVKLVDFGVCALLQEQVGRRDTVIGTPYWMAPEVCRRNIEKEGGRSGRV